MAPRSTSRVKIVSPNTGTITHSRSISIAPSSVESTHTSNELEYNCGHQVPNTFSTSNQICEVRHMLGTLDANLPFQPPKPLYTVISEPLSDYYLVDKSSRFNSVERSSGDHSRTNSPVSQRAQGVAQAAGWSVLKKRTKGFPRCLPKSTDAITHPRTAHENSFARRWPSPAVSTGVHDDRAKDGRALRLPTAIPTHYNGYDSSLSRRQASSSSASMASWKRHRSYSVTSNCVDGEDNSIDGEKGDLHEWQGKHRGPPLRRDFRPAVDERDTGEQFNCPGVRNARSAFRTTSPIRGQDSNVTAVTSVGLAMFHGLSSIPVTEELFETKHSASLTRNSSCGILGSGSGTHSLLCGGVEHSSNISNEKKDLKAAPFMQSSCPRYCSQPLWSLVGTFKTPITSVVNVDYVQGSLRWKQRNPKGGFQMIRIPLGGIQDAVVAHITQEDEDIQEKQFTTIIRTSTRPSQVVFGFKTLSEAKRMCTMLKKCLRFLEKKNSVSQQEVPVSPVGSPQIRKNHTCTESLIQQLLQIIEASSGNKSNTNKASSSNEEEITVALTSCVANALHNINSGNALDEVPRTYWVDLAQQIEVDRWVEFSRYCAANGFRPLKAKHLMECLMSYKQLVEQAKLYEEETVEEGKEYAATQQQGFQVSPIIDNTLSLLPNGSDMPTIPSKGDEVTGTVSEAGLPSVPFWVHIQQHLKDFVTKEVDLGCKWERVHHSVDVSFGVSTAGTGPTLNASVQRIDEDAAFGSERPSAAGTLNKRKGKGEKTSRQQQLLQQQQEQLDEERRQIVATMSATMPSENIYLTPIEIPDFVNYLYRGLLQHAALYQYLSQYPQETERKIEGLQMGSLGCFLLPLEEPMPVPPLSLSTEVLSTYSAVVEPVPPILTKNSRTNTVAVVPSSSTAAASAETTKTLSPFPGKGLEMGTCEKVSESPLVALQALQRQEIDRLVMKHNEEIANEERRARAEQTEKEMTLFFELYGTQKAVDDVYTSIDYELRQQQWRILQRVKALEVALGIN